MRKYGQPIIIYLVAFFIMPYVTMHLLNINDGFAIIIINLLLINSISVFVVSLILTYKYGLDYIHILLMLMLFSLSVYTVFNDSALVYNLFYLLFDFIGISTAYYIRKKTK